MHVLLLSSNTGVCVLRLLLFMCTYTVKQHGCVYTTPPLINVYYTVKQHRQRSDEAQSLVRAAEQRSETLLYELQSCKERAVALEMERDAAKKVFVYARVRA